jgi:perosamine synthetase
MNSNNLISEIIKNIRKISGKGSIALHEPVFWSDEKKNLNKCIKSSYVSSGGKYVHLFEKKIKNYTKANYVVATNSGTSALHISCIISGIRKNDEVLIPSLNFVASPNVLLNIGAIPHFVDSDEETLGINLIKLEKYLNKISFRKKNNIFNKKTNRRIVALFPTHVFGHSINIEELNRIAKKYSLKIIEDASEAMGSFYKKKHLGTFGSVGTLSFNGNKTITTGSGGAILISKKKDYLQAKRLINVSKLDHPWKLEYNGVGFNYRMSNIEAALGYSQLNSLEKIIKMKYRLLEDYKQVFKNFSYAHIFELKKNRRSNYWLQTLLLNKEVKYIRNKLLEKANKEKLMLRPIWRLMHTLPHLKKFPKMNLSKSIELEKRIINLPSSIYV